MNRFLRCSLSTVSLWLLPMGIVPAKELVGPEVLDAYLARPEPGYRWELADTVEGQGTRSHMVDMVSQTWLTKDDVDRTEWRHWLIVTVPDAIRSNTALLIISGGDNTDHPPSTPDSRAERLARSLGVVVAEVNQVPNEPLRFDGDDRQRKEDDLLAYAGQRFLKTGDTRWIARLPMVKSAVKAMDTVTALMQSEVGGRNSVDNFIVLGASKRGWTTWLVGAADRRVSAIVPIVIDCLNLRESIPHHFAAYGFWAPAIGDYARHGLLEQIQSPAYQRLLAIDDPHSYRHRVTMPKLIINSTGDQYFLPDSWQFYFDQLVGEKHLSYVPNTDHSLEDSDAVERVGAFCQLCLTGRPRPEYSWQCTADGRIEVECVTRPRAVRLWQAHNPQARDFRLETIGKAYTSTPLREMGPGQYVAEPPEIDEGFAAYFVEMEFPNDAGLPVKLTTGVRVTPDVLPFANELPEGLQPGPAASID